MAVRTWDGGCACDKPQQAEAVGTAALTAAAKGAHRHLARHAFLYSMMHHNAACAASSGWSIRQLIIQTHGPLHNALGPPETAARRMQVTQALRSTKHHAPGVDLSARTA